MKPGFPKDGGATHPLIYHFLRQRVSHENVIEISFYNTILRFINIFLIYFSHKNLPSPLPVLLPRIQDEMHRQSRDTADLLRIGLAISEIQGWGRLGVDLGEPSERLHPGEETIL